MGIKSVVESFEDRSAEGDLFERKYTRKFWVETDNPTTTQAEVAAAAGVPRIGQPFIGANGFVDVGVFCNRVQARQRNEHPCFWAVDVGYTNRLDRAGGGGAGGGSGGGGGSSPLEQATSPLLRPAEVRWGLSRFTVAVLRTYAGEALLNSAGSPFSPPPEMEDARLTLTVVRNQLSYDAVGYLAYFSAVNIQPFVGFAPYQVRCNGITGERSFESGIFYWKVTYEFEVHWRDWRLRVLDAGYYEKVAGKQRPITRAGRQVTTPWPLNGAGVALPEDGSGTPVFREFVIRGSLDFNNLGLF